MTCPPRRVHDAGRAVPGREPRPTVLRRPRPCRSSPPHVAGQHDRILPGAEQHGREPDHRLGQLSRPGPMSANPARAAPRWPEQCRRPSPRSSGVGGAGRLCLVRRCRQSSVCRPAAGRDALTRRRGLAPDRAPASLRRDTGGRPDHRRHPRAMRAVLRDSRSAVGRCLAGRSGFRHTAGPTARDDATNGGAPPLFALSGHGSGVARPVAASWGAGPPPRSRYSTPRESPPSATPRWQPRQSWGWWTTRAAPWGGGRLACRAVAVSRHMRAVRWLESVLHRPRRRIVVGGPDRIRGQASREHRTELMTPRFNPSLRRMLPRWNPRLSARAA